ncbi:MAG: cytidine deaminase [Cyanophyceae cyanobacterium]
MLSNNQLYNAAKQASRNAYSPYSEFKVGAAVLTKSGSVYTGCYDENASYSNTICAERVALVKAISEGDKSIYSIAIYTEDADLSPCGICRQFIREFGSEIKVIYLSSGEIIAKAISELLPDSFSKDNLY